MHHTVESNFARPMRALALTLAAVWLIVSAGGCAPRGDSPSDGEGPRLDYGPILRTVEATSAHVLFGSGKGQPWTAALQLSTLPSFPESNRIELPEIEVDAATDFIAHFHVGSLTGQTRYFYRPLVNGSPLGRFEFETLADLDGSERDFTALFFSDLHLDDSATAPSVRAFETAAALRPNFWAQLGDVASGSMTGLDEGRRTRGELRAIWRRNFGDSLTAQARFAASVPLNLATISDHEMSNNFSLNWHQSLSNGVAEATLHDRVELYDRSMEVWWNHLGWSSASAEPLAAVAADDHGESVMAGAEWSLLADSEGAELCLPRHQTLGAGDFVYVTDDRSPALHTRIAEVTTEACADEGLTLRLEAALSTALTVEAKARVAEGARYSTAGHYRSYSPSPFVEFMVVDTSSYRGDPYAKKSLYAEDANADSDHARYRWNADEGRQFIHGDREHGANATTDEVRSWLGPTQKTALLRRIAESEADVLVLTAGYPLYSAKFEWSERYWPGRECGFDFAREAEEITDALEATGKLVLWVHGDGHSPMLVRLRPDIYQLQVGATMSRHTGSPGHRARTLQSGDRSTGALIGGGEMIAGLQPDISLGDGSEDLFDGRFEQFEGFLRLYFHPGREAWRNVERVGIQRGESERELLIDAPVNPARGSAAEQVVGRVVRLEFEDRTRHSVVTGYRHDGRNAVVTLRDPIVDAQPLRARLLLPGHAWVEARWFDAEGQEWREYGRVLRKAAPDAVSR